MININTKINVLAVLIRTYTVHIWQKFIKMYEHYQHRHKFMSSIAMSNINEYIDNYS